jgi:hypothetical protein
MVSSFFVIKKLNFLLHLSIDLNFRQTSKKIEGGSPKKILEKKNVFPKKYVELRTFDGTCKSILSIWGNSNLANFPYSYVQFLPNESNRQLTKFFD